MLGREVAIQKGHQLEQLLGEIVDRQLLASIALKRERVERGAAGRTADAEIDTVGIHGVKHAKDFRHLEGAIVRQHHAA